MESEVSDSSSQAPTKVSEKELTANLANAEPHVKVTAIEPPSKPAAVESPTSATNSESVAKPANVESTASSTGGDSSAKANDIVPCPPDASPRDSQQSTFSSSGLSAWAKNLRFPQQDSQTGNSGVSAFARFTSGLGLHLPPKASDGATDGATTQGSSLESFTKGLVDSSRGAVKAMQVKARHIVSQNKRRYQEGEFDLDMTYITENIIAMGFPAGDLSSGFFGFFEGLYRNHMEEVIKFFETHHKEKYKVYNLCSERLYDASRFEGKVASFPFDDHNCPPIQLIPSFCQSSYSWLKEDIQNVVVVHCKAGIARTGLMICCLLLYLKFFPTAEEAIDYYNQKRCVDGKALVLPSQIRYVKYYERVLTYFNGEIPPGRRCMLRGFRLINCPYWIRPSITISNHSGILFSTKKHPRTKDLMPQDFWIKAPRKGVVVFALPGEPGLTELAGDFKILFHEGQGDFYCWLNTAMTENRITLSGADLDGFDKRKLPSPGFQIEIVMMDYDSAPLATKPKADSATKQSETGPDYNQTRISGKLDQNKVSGNEENEHVFSDSDGDESGISKVRKSQADSNAKTEMTGAITHGANNLSTNEPPESNCSSENKSFEAGKASLGVQIPVPDSIRANDIKAMAADASVFSFGDEEDYESD